MDKPMTRQHPLAGRFDCAPLFVCWSSIIYVVEVHNRNQAKRGGPYRTESNGSAVCLLAAGAAV